MPSNFALIVRAVPLRCLLLALLLGLPLSAAADPDAQNALAMGLDMTALYDFDPLEGRTHTAVEGGLFWDLFRPASNPRMYLSLQFRATMYLFSSRYSHTKKKKDEDGEDYCWDPEKEEEVPSQFCRSFFNDGSGSLAAEAALSMQDVGLPLFVGGGYRALGDFQGAYFVVASHGGFVRLRGNDQFVGLSLLVPVGIGFF